MSNYRPNDLFKLINNIKYGYVDRKSNIHIGDDEKWFSTYKLQSKDELLTNMVGNCYDVVELLRFFLERNYKVETFFMMIALPYKNNYPTHSYLIYLDNNCYNLIENKFGLNCGINSFKTREEVVRYQALSYLKFLKDNYNLKSKEEKYFITTSFNKPKSGSSALSYIDNALSGSKVVMLVDGEINYKNYEEIN